MRKNKSWLLACENKTRQIKPHLHNSICLFSLLLLFFISCNGQVKNNFSKIKLETTNELTKLPKAKNAFTAASVSCAIQDKDGNIWLGTNGEGLFLYDGKTFKNFGRQDGLDHNIIYSLLQDNKGNIWVGTRKGLFRYNGKAFIHIPITVSNADNFRYGNSSDNNLSSQSGVWTMSIMQDRNGIIWFGTEDGVYCYKDMSFTGFLDNDIINKDSLHLKGIFSFTEDNKGNIWFGSCTGEGLIRYDGKTLERISPRGYARTQGLTLDRKENIWFASVGKGMCQYNGNSITTNFFNEKSTYDLMYIILKDKNENLWFSEPANNRSLCYYNGNESHNFTEIKNLPDNKMYPVLEDTSGNIWFAAEGMRLFKWNNKTFTDFSE